MSKKSKQPKPKKRPTTNPSRTDKLFDLIGHQIFQRDYAGAIANSKRLLSYLPQRTPQRADVLAQMGVAHAILQNYPQSYEAFTSRFGRSLRDFERAAELNAATKPTFRTLHSQFS